MSTKYRDLSKEVQKPRASSRQKSSPCPQSLCLQCRVRALCIVSRLSGWIALLSAHLAGLPLQSSRHGEARHEVLSVLTEGPGMLSRCWAWYGKSLPLLETMTRQGQGEKSGSRSLMKHWLSLSSTHPETSPMEEAASHWGWDASGFERPPEDVRTRLWAPISLTLRIQKDHPALAPD